MSRMRPGSLPDRAARALARPDLVWRRLRGLPVIDIDLDEIAPFLPSDPVILEAGAQNGSDTVRFAQHWPAAIIHAFEPVPAAYADVVAATRQLPAVSTYPAALGTHVGTATMYVDGEAGAMGGSSSLLAPTAELAREFPSVSLVGRVEVPVTTIDAWMDAQGVDRLDFAWLDLQGMELDVLRASPRAVRSLRVIHLEVARIDLYEGAPLRDEVLDWLRGQGFRVAIDRVPVRIGNVLCVRQ